VTLVQASKCPLKVKSYTLHHMTWAPIQKTGLLWQMSVRVVIHSGYRVVCGPVMTHDQGPTAPLANLQGTECHHPATTSVHDVESIKTPFGNTGADAPGANRASGAQQQQRATLLCLQHTEGMQSALKIDQVLW
jgi:hypothetical protein